MTYITLSSILTVLVLASCATWLRLLVGLMKSPKSKIMKFSDRSSRLNENSLYHLKKEVNLFHNSPLFKTTYRSSFLDQSIILHYQISRCISQYQHTTRCSHRWSRCLRTTTYSSNSRCKSIHPHRPFIFFLLLASSRTFNERK